MFAIRGSNCFTNYSSIHCAFTNAFEISISCTDLDAFRRPFALSLTITNQCTFGTTVHAIAVVESNKSPELAPDNFVSHL